MAEITKETISKGLDLAAAVAKVIAELGEVPSGVLYAAVQSKFPKYSLDVHTALLNLLEQTKLIEINNHLIKWIVDKK